MKFRRPDFPPATNASLVSRGLSFRFPPESTSTRSSRVRHVVLVDSPPPAVLSRVSFTRIKKPFTQRNVDFLFLVTMTRVSIFYSLTPQLDKTPPSSGKLLRIFVRPSLLKNFTSSCVFVIFFLFVGTLGPDRRGSCSELLLLMLDGCFYVTARGLFLFCPSGGIPFPPRLLSIIGTLTPSPSS